MTNTTVDEQVGAQAAPAAKVRVPLMDIERAKGLGILLVVYGHLVMFNTFGEQPWYAVTKDTIYLFHMPLFLYLSGFVFNYVDAAGRARKAFGQFVARRADRLLVPFFVSAIIIVTGKYLASRFVDVDQAVNGYLEGYHSLFFNTEFSPVLSIWYLYVLFIYSVLTPPLLWLTRGRVLPILALAVVMYFLPVTTDFYLYRVFHYYVFFVLGWAACSQRDIVLPAYGRFLIPALIAFAASLFLDRSWYPAVLIAGTLSLPAIHGLLRTSWMSGDRILAFFGRYSMVIYLLNTIAIGVAKVIYSRILPFDGPYFALFIIVLLAAGVFGPILVRQLIGAVDRRGVVTKYLD